MTPIEITGYVLDVSNL